MRQLADELPQGTFRRALPGLEARAWTYASSATYRAPKTAHRTLEISWMERGTVGFEIGRERIELRGAIAVPAGVEHVTRFEGPMRGRTLHFGADLVDSVADALGVRLASAQTVDDRVIALGRMLIEEAAQSDPSALLAIDGLAQAMLAMLSRSAHGERNHACDPRIRRAIEFVRERYAEPLSVDDLAREAGMSRFHFSRALRAQCGKSPYQLVVETRVAAAAVLLKAGRASVGEAALTVGFTDMSRFARAFRRIHGCAPSEVRSGDPGPAVGR